ncbi:hypothetical protein JZ751_024390 [Albula glossodonta]|uniref:Acyltransferase n=1 Tax=Albula glossodonta TaxID=121402 RepID=A0A8T2NMZ6_9TELE|nr:hypothetical protein JZ751_024390 [Albula glossodonta]
MREEVRDKRREERRERRMKREEQRENSHQYCASGDITRRCCHIPRFNRPPAKACADSVGGIEGALFPRAGKAAREAPHTSGSGIRRRTLHGIEGQGTLKTGLRRVVQQSKAAEMEEGQTQWKEFVEKISVLQWVLTFLLMGVSCVLLMVYLMFTCLWLLPTLYTIWMLTDWDTPEQGGRRVEWVRKWTVWKHFRDYFPVKLVKTAELDPSKNYILGSHPHGIMCAGAFSCFSTESCGFAQAFPGMRSCLAILAGLFRMPLYRDYLMSAGFCSAGMCPVSKPSLEFLLSRNGTGNVVVIVIGGAAESLASSPGVNTVVMRQRKGFVRLALEYGGWSYGLWVGGGVVMANGQEETGFFNNGGGRVMERGWGYGLCKGVGLWTMRERGWGYGKKEKGGVMRERNADLVPVYNFGENELFRQVVFQDGSIMRTLQTAFKRVMGFAPCLFIGQSWGLVPYKTPITTVVGRPISVPQFSSPPEEMVDHYHSLYMEALTQLFHAHKTRCGLSETHQLQII